MRFVLLLNIHNALINLFIFDKSDVFKNLILGACFVINLKLKLMGVEMKIMIIILFFVTDTFMELVQRHVIPYSIYIMLEILY